jgi:hypothetical protein
VLPQLLGKRHRVDVRGLPPRRLVAVSVNGPMVGTAERHREFIADPPSHRSRLYEPQMVSVRGLSPTQQARLRRYELQVGAIAVAAWFAHRKGAFVDMSNNEF